MEDDLDTSRGILVAVFISAAIYAVTAWWLLSRGAEADQRVVEESLLQMSDCRRALEIAERHATILDHVIAGGKLTYAGRTISCKERS